MSFQSRSQFINAFASEKITLAQVEGRKRIINWTSLGAGVYKKTVDYYVIAAHNGLTAFNQAANSSVASGDFFYDPATSELYIHLIGSVDPVDYEIIVTFQFHFASKGLALPFDLDATSPHTDWEGRLEDAPGFNHKVGIEQGLTSIVGTGTLKLENNDGGLDEFYDTHIFENQKVRIYSWNPDLSIDDARIIYRGRITNKTYTPDSVSFTVKDLLFDLEQQLPQGVFSDSDNVADNVKGNIKRWVYGRADGLQLQSVDQIANGVDVTGTLSGNTETTTITGTSTLFLSELSPGDTLFIGTQEFGIATIVSDTELEVDDEPEFAFTNLSATYVPDVPLRTKNRTFFVADHECAQLLKTVVNSLQLNRVELNDTIGILPGDFLEFSDVSQRVEVKNVAPGNIVVLRQNLISRPAPSTSVIRQPIQDVYISGVRVFDEDFSISNSVDTRITLDELTEFNLARTISLTTELTFTNGSRSLTTVDDVNLRDIFKSRDWIRPQNISYTTFYEILEVRDQEILLRIPFAEATITDEIEAKFPEYIDDDTTISANVLGRTVDGDKNSDWIYTIADTIKDIITSVGVADIDDASFTQGAIDNSEIVSIAFPLTPSSSLTKAKDAVDILNKSIQSALTLNSDLEIKFKVLNVEIPSDPVRFADSDQVKWSIKSVSGRTIRNTIIRYRFQDVIRTTLDNGNEVQTYENEYVRDYIGTDKTGEYDVYLYSERAARIMSHRLAYFSELARADVTVESDLRFEDVEIGDTVQLQFSRMYKRFGDSTSRKKLVVVVGKNVTGDKIVFQMTDLNNTFNTACVITPNNAPDYSAADEEERLKYGYITDAEGIVDDDEDTQNTNLIT